MTSMCVVMPYFIWWGKYDLEDMIYGCVVTLVAFLISAWLAKRIINKIHS